MKTYLIAIFLMFAFHPSFSQTVAVIRKGDKQNLDPAHDFAFIEKATDTSMYEFVATYEATGKKTERNISRLFFKIAKSATNDGANCFRFVSFARNDSNKSATLVLDAFYWNDSTRIINFNNHEKKTIYLFAGETPGDQSLSFKINGEKKSIKYGTFYRITGKAGDEIKVNKGGFTGMTMTYVMDEGKAASFLNMLEGGINGVETFGGQGAGVSFNTGRLERVPGDLGLLLIHVLKQSE